MFDRVVAVDWSASSTPKRGADSIWIASVGAGSGPLATTNVPTRTRAVDVLEALLGDAARRGERVLVGFDFSFGYPAGTPWGMDELADRIEDDERNRNNRFDVAAELNARVGDGAGPFWGFPASRTTPVATTKKPGDLGLPEFRSTESVLHRRGLRPFSCWQLLGAGAVGGQSLVGIPRLVELRARLAGSGVGTEIWPIDAGAGVPGAQVVVVEIWPSMIPTDASAGAVRDEAQVASCAHWLLGLDATGRLDALFTPIGAPVDDVLRREGWVFGVSGSPR